MTAGSFDATLFPDGSGAHARGIARFSAPPAHAPSDAIVVPDAHFLFNAEFKRSGADLILSGDGRELVLHDYFRGEKRAALASPDGAHLSGDLVSTLTGAVQVSQAGGAPAAGQVIGHVTKLQGTATAIRNGVSIILHQGDNVEKGDIVQSGSDSTLGITFIDGTVFGLASNARMVLNEMVYDPNGSNNSSLISLVAGTISFVAGATAKHGDMKVDTPVATMGIRGTAVLVQIDFTVPGQGATPDAKFQVLVEPDGTTGSYVLFDKVTLQPIAVVNQAGHQINISNGIVTQTDSALPPDIQKLITDVFSLKFTDNSNPKSSTHFTDIGVPDTFNPIKLADGTTAIPTFVVTNSTSTSTTDISFNPSGHMPGKPNAVVLDDTGKPSTAFALTERVGKTADTADLDTVKGAVNYADANPGDQPSASVSFKSFSYQNAQHANLSLNALQLQDITASEIGITVVQDPNHKNFGTATWTYSIADNAFDFLAAGETLTLTYIVRVDNNFAPSNEFTEIPITITVIGTNDKPVITTSAQTITFSGGTSVVGGALTSTDHTSGTLSFADVDLTDTHTVSVALTSPQQSNIPQTLWELFNKALTASIATDSTGTGTGTVKWTLADLPAYAADFIPAGQAVTLTYTVTVTDSQGAATQQTVTVTITGTDAPAVVWIATTSGTDGESTDAPPLLWRDGANWETGNAPTANDDVWIVTDQLRGLNPAFPVTIDKAAFAKSVTMNDFGGGKTPELDNLSTLTIGGALTVKADARVYNSLGATISVGGQAEFLDHSELDNSGTLLLHAGGEFGAYASVTNTGTIELVSGTLNILGDLVNANDDAAGAIQVDLGATLALDGGSIAGGTVIVEGGEPVRNLEVTSSNQPADGVLALQGGAALSDGTLDSSGAIIVSGNGNALHREAVMSSGTLDILTGGKLTLDQGTAWENYDGTIAVAGSADLTLDHAGIAGGTLTNDGTVALTGYAALIGGSLVNSGTVTVSGAGNTLENEIITNTVGATLTIALAGVLALSETSIAGGAVHNAGVIDVVGNSTIDGSAVAGGYLSVGELTAPQDGGGESSLPVVLTIQDGASIADAHLTIGQTDSIAIATADGATLSGVSVDNGGAVTVGQGALLVLENSTISGGALANAGTIHVETNAETAFDNVNVDNGATGVIVVDDEGEAPVPSHLTLDGQTTITGGLLTIGVVGTLEVAGLGAILSGVHVENSGVFTVDHGAILDLVGTDVTGDGTFHVWGTIEASGFSIVSSSIINDGIIEITSGTLDLTGSMSGSGTIIVDAGARLELNSSYAQTIDFAGQGGEFVLDAASFNGKIEGLDVSDKLDLSAIKFNDNPTASYDAATGVLTVSDSDGHSVSLTLSGADYSNAAFAASNDGSGGTLITLKATDDAPVIADAAQNGELTEQHSTTGSSVADSASGTIHFTDIDLTDRPSASIAEQTVTWTAADGCDISASLTSGEIDALKHALALAAEPGNTNNGAVDWTYSIADGALDFLGAGQTLTVTSKVTVDDGKGGQAATTVTVTINGSNDTPVVTSEAQLGAIPERAGTSGSNQLDTAGGTITFTDADVTDTHLVKVTGVSVSGDGSGLPDIDVVKSWLFLRPLTDSQNGATGSQGWSFTASDKIFDYLGIDHSVQLTYTVEIDDRHGGVVDVPVTVTISGAEDTPVIVGETNPPVQTVILAKAPTVLAAGVTSAQGMATETFDEVSAGSASNNGHGHGNFYSDALHASFSASGDAGVVHGSSSDSAAPFVGDGQDHTNYLSIGGHAQETISFDSAMNSFGLYWGSVDSYNSVSFYDGTKLVASYSGDAVAPLLANGGQGSFASNGYVEFSDLAPFNKVVLTSTHDAFELDNVSAGWVDDSHVKLASNMTGTLTVLDRDVGDTLSASVVGKGFVEYNGSFDLPATANIDSLVKADAVTFDSVVSDGGADVLHWSYHPANADLDFLEPGDTLTITYLARISDGHGSFDEQPLTVTVTGNGSSVVAGTAQNDSFDNVGGGVTVFGNGGNDTFVFNSHFNSATIADFDVQKDTIQIDHALFNSVQAVLNSAQAANLGHDTVITDAANETITLKGVTLAQLQAHQNDFHIV
ncbi:conserved hypothetical protein [Bradyrhizobium sp. STM 3843]|uniref:Npun_F0296 family exosortase-dependent surface protein n=1 Tax=Bradyrhizobium sp. STM 3843 TaxID=551947 RepID=UPI000240AEDD|nr:VCBS domain-containing protein [Bradyrhizobium sp. STM 3843]CCE05640.1 conserved hypothetical protein [Bradyrhizobium sp. STM 3843]